MIIYLMTIFSSMVSIEIDSVNSCSLVVVVNWYSTLEEILF